MKVYVYMAVKYSLGDNFILYVGLIERYNMPDYLNPSFMFVKLIIADCHHILSGDHSLITAPFAVCQHMSNFRNLICDIYCEEMSSERLWKFGFNLKIWVSALKWGGCHLGWNIDIALNCNSKQKQNQPFSCFLAQKIWFCCYGYTKKQYCLYFFLSQIW